MEKAADAFRTISEVADELDLPQHVLRFWETRFPQIRPMKRAGGRRYYRPGDVVVLRGIRRLLYDDGYTIKGVQRLLRETGVKELRGAIADDAGITVEAASLPGEDADDVLHDASNGGAEPNVGPAAAKVAPADLSSLQDVLAVIEECERLLRQCRVAEL